MSESLILLAQYALSPFFVLFPTNQAYSFLVRPCKTGMYLILFMYRPKTDNDNDIS